MDYLHQNIHRKLTFLSAPAGFGKTTLLVDFVSDIDAKVCWYQAGAVEDDLAAFFRHFLAAFQQVYPEMGKGLLNLVSEPDRVNPQLLALEFSNEALQEIEDYTLLVIDDYQLVSHNESIVNFIETVLEHLPDQMRMLIGSRSVYGIPSAELYVREELALVSMEELRFTPEELVDLSRQHYQVKLTEKEAKKIIQNTGGWILAILLALRGEHPAALIPRLAGAKQQIFNYLKTEVLDRVDPQIKHFLLVTSIYNEFYQDLCDFVFQSTDSAKMIQQLEEQNLFITRVETQAAAYYQYHQLFREFLMDTLGDEYSPEEIKAFHMQSAEYYRTRHFRDMAIEHLLLAEENEQAVALMDEVSQQYYSSGRHGILQDWYSRICEDMVLKQKAPHLVFYVAKTVINQGELKHGLELLDLAERILRGQGKAEQLVSVLATKGITYRFTGDYRRCLSLGDEIIKLVEEEQLYPYYLYQAERLKGIASHFLNDRKAAVILLSSAVDGIRTLCRNDKSDNLYHELIMVLADLGYVAIKQGDIFLAQKCFNEALQTSRMLRGQQGDVAMSANNQAYLNYLQGNYSQAWKYYEQALEAAQAAGWRRIIVDIHNGRGEVLRDIQEWERAQEEFNQAIKYKSRAQEDPAFWDTHLGMAELERLRGNFNEANFHLREAAICSGEDLELPKYMVRRAHVFLTMGHIELSREKLKDALTLLEQEEYPSTDRVKAYLLLAELHYIQGKKEEAVAPLMKALSDVAELGFDAFFIVLCKEAFPFLTDIQLMVQNKQLDDLIDRAKDFQPRFEDLFTAVSEEPASRMPSVQVQGFGKGEVRVEGRSVQVSKWKSVGARALFFYIVDRGKTSKDEISLEFWPDFSSGKVNSNFHATLWRVRNALGIKELIDFDGEYYQFNPLASLFYDVREFELLATQFSHSNEDATEKRASGYQALSLYKEDFLLDVDMRWSDERRRGLHQQVVNILDDLAQFELAEARYENARELFQRAIEYDGFQDEFHYGLMSAMIALGNRLEAKKHYQNYQNTLSQELNTVPSKQLEDLYNSI